MSKGFAVKKNKKIRKNVHSFRKYTLFRKTSVLIIANVMHFKQDLLDVFSTSISNDVTSTLISKNYNSKHYIWRSHQ